MVDNASNGASEQIFRAFRDGFPGMTNQTYLSVAARGLMSRTTREALDGAFDAQMLGRVNKEEWKAAGARARQAFALIVGAQATEVAAMKNVSDGLNAIATALPWTPGDNMVFCPDFEHPNAVYAWLNLERRGVEPRAVPLDRGMVDVAAIERAIDAGTRLVAISSVSFASGFRADLERLGSLCRDRGVFFLVDGAQSAGILNIDVHRCRIDGFAASANKGLLGIYGLGFLFCRQQWAERLQPAYLSRFGIDVAGVHESELGPADYQLYRGARRFEVGNANWPGLIAAESSMSQLLALGGQAIEDRVLSLARSLADGLAQEGFAVDTPDDLARRSHIVTVSPALGGAEAIDCLGQELRRRKIVFSVRRGGIRFGIHAYNNLFDIESVVDAARQAGPGR